MNGWCVVIYDTFSGRGTLWNGPEAEIRYFQYQIGNQEERVLNQ